MFKVETLESQIILKLLEAIYSGFGVEWAKREKEDLDILSGWVKSVMSLIQIRI
jgi:hypothetical protein